MHHPLYQIPPDYALCCSQLVCSLAAWAALRFSTGAPARSEITALPRPCWMTPLGSMQSLWILEHMKRARLRVLAVCRPVRKSCSISRSPMNSPNLGWGIVLAYMGRESPSHDYDGAANSKGHNTRWTQVKSLRSEAHVCMTDMGMYRCKMYDAGIAVKRLK
jgi:hypothetical protein